VSIFPSALTYPGSALYPDPDAIPYTGVTVTYGTELLYNRAVISNLGGTPQTAENTASISEYGVVSLELNGLLIDTDADCDALANYIVNKYADPDLRFDTIDIQLAGLTTYQQERVLSIELSDVIRVEYEPNGFGGRIVKDVEVIGIRHDARPSSHAITFQLGSTDTAAFVFAAGTSVAEYPFSVIDSSPFGL
jgi:hypothetical protein